MFKKIVCFSFFLTVFTVNAQLYEIGVLAGGSNYVGDVGNEYFINPNKLYVGGIFKRNANKRFSLRGTYTYTEISSNDANSINDIRKERDYKFSNHIHELSGGIEFNFWKFDIEDVDYRHTPYLLFEFAILRHKIIDAVSVDRDNYTYSTRTAYAIPFGGGYKFRLFRDFVMGIELRGRYALTDAIDFNNKNTPKLRFGNPNSNDWYFFSGIQLTYVFGRPPCYSTAF